MRGETSLQNRITYNKQANSAIKHRLTGGGDVWDDCSLMLSCGLSEMLKVSLQLSSPPTFRGKSNRSSDFDICSIIRQTRGGYNLLSSSASLACLLGKSISLANI